MKWDELERINPEFVAWAREHHGPLTEQILMDDYTAYRAEYDKQFEMPRRRRKR